MFPFKQEEKRMQIKREGRKEKEAEGERAYHDEIRMDR